MEIKGIDGINNIIPPRKTKKFGGFEEPKREDKVSISEDAKLKIELEKYKEIVKGIPDIREDKVKIAKEKIARGNLITKEALEKVADRLAEKLLIGDKILKKLGEEE